MTINPFEEANTYRLEQSVLSPNLFQEAASTSTPEQGGDSPPSAGEVATTTSASAIGDSLWNIEQRAVLYPADIPTDESSLFAQYICDDLQNFQMNAAVEAFWSRNQVWLLN